MKLINIQIFDKWTDSWVRAELWENPGNDYIETTQDLWSLYREHYLQELQAAGKSAPEHNHWNWKEKLKWHENSLYDCFAIVHNDAPQGLMMVKHGRSKLPQQRDQPLVYVEFLESAPWNLKGYCDVPRYSAVGRRLYEAAAQFSRSLGFDGRIGLRSLPGAETFYEQRGMKSLILPGEHLTYFESVADSSTRKKQ